MNNIIVELLHHNYIVFVTLLCNVYKASLSMSSYMNFCVPKTAGFQETLSELEIFALIVGCVCHDLDHRGTNNAFQAKYDKY